MENYQRSLNLHSGSFNSPTGTGVKIRLNSHISPKGLTITPVDRNLYSTIDYQKQSPNKIRLPSFLQANKNSNIKDELEAEIIFAKL